MTKMRVHELAKELGMDNKELMEILQKKNVEVKNHMSTLEDNVTEEIRRQRLRRMRMLPRRKRRRRGRRRRKILRS